MGSQKCGTLLGVERPGARWSVASSHSTRDMFKSLQLPHRLDWLQSTSIASGSVWPQFIVLQVIVRVIHTEIGDLRKVFEPWDAIVRVSSWVEG
jgi:hypothetical protein